MNEIIVVLVSIPTILLLVMLCYSCYYLKCEKCLEYHSGQQKERSYWDIWLIGVLRQ